MFDSIWSFFSSCFILVISFSTEESLLEIFAETSALSFCFIH